jgi:hypothetical protein
MAWEWHWNPDGLNGPGSPLPRRAAAFHDPRHMCCSAPCALNAFVVVLCRKSALSSRRWTRHRHAVRNVGRDKRDGRADACSDGGSDDRRAHRTAASSASPHPVAFAASNPVRAKRARPFARQECAAGDAGAVVLPARGQLDAAVVEPHRVDRRKVGAAGLPGPVPCRASAMPGQCHAGPVPCWASAAGLPGPVPVMSWRPLKTSEWESPSAPPSRAAWEAVDMGLQPAWPARPGRRAVPREHRLPQREHGAQRAAPIRLVVANPASPA